MAIRLMRIVSDRSNTRKRKIFRRKKVKKEQLSHVTVKNKNSTIEDLRTRTYLDVEIKDPEVEGEAELKDSPQAKTDKGDDHGEQWAKAICNKGLRSLLKQFSSVRKYLPENATTVYYKQNVAKNRYEDVLCLDETRVILKGRPPNNDYIHANWVQLPSKRSYICTQGPLQDTIEDFWLMVFKEDVRAIIMLCDFMEHGESKCAGYYPQTAGDAVPFGEIRVKNEKIVGLAEEIICILLSVQFEDEERSVYHFKWLGWPDKSSPESPATLIALMQKVRPLHVQGPVVVHCSAGIGRTGTFCAVDYAMDKLFECGTIVGVDIVKEIRHQRLHSVQSSLQYVYMHICLLEWLAVGKTIPRDQTLKNFQCAYEKYLRKFNERIAKAMKR